MLIQRGEILFTFFLIFSGREKKKIEYRRQRRGRGLKGAAKVALRVEVTRHVCVVVDDGLQLIGGWEVLRHLGCDYRVQFRGRAPVHLHLAQYADLVMQLERLVKFEMVIGPFSIFLGGWKNN